MVTTISTRRVGGWNGRHRRFQRAALGWRSSSPAGPPSRRSPGDERGLLDIADHDISSVSDRPADQPSYVRGRTSMAIPATICRAPVGRSALAESGMRSYQRVVLRTGIRRFGAGFLQATK